MSERAPQPQQQMQMPKELEQFSGLDAQVYKNGSRHVYGIDKETGKRVHLSGDDVLSAYGYGPEDLPTNAEQPGNPEPVQTQEAPDKDLYDEYNEAVKNGDAKDTTFRQWVKANSQREAAKWYSGVRSHGEAHIARSDSSMVDSDERGRGDIDVELLSNEDHQERLNSREGKKNPSEDDVEYYKWLKQQSGGSGESTDGGDNGGDAPENDPTPTEELPVVPEQAALPEELNAELIEARNEYIDLTARRRRVITVGHKKKLAAAKERYENARNAAGAEAARMLAESGASEDEVRTFSLEAAIVETSDLEKLLWERRVELSDSKKLKKFYDWWARQGGHKLLSFAGLKGAAKKSLAMGVVGFVPGVIAGVAGSVIAGPVVGAAAGAAVARGVARGLAGAKINKEAEAARVAQAQSGVHETEGHDSLNAKHDEGDVLQTEDITATVEAKTKNEVRRNRRRSAASAIIGAASGLGGAIVADHFLNGGGGGGNRPTGNRPTGGRPDHTPAGKPPVPETPEVPPVTPEAVPPAPNVNLDQWTWNVAHDLQPGNEVPLMNRALEQYSAETGLASRLVPSNGTTMIEVNGHIVNPAEMHRINEIVAQLGS